MEENRVYAHVTYLHSIYIGMGLYMQQRWKRGYKKYRDPIFHLLFIDNSVSGGGGGLLELTVLESPSEGLQQACEDLEVSPLDRSSILLATVDFAR